MIYVCDAIEFIVEPHVLPSGGSSYSEARGYCPLQASNLFWVQGSAKVLVSAKPVWTNVCMVFFQVICRLGKLMKQKICLPDIDEALVTALHNIEAHKIPQAYGAIDMSQMPVLAPSDGYFNLINRKGQLSCSILHSRRSTKGRTIGRSASGIGTL